MLRTSRLSRLTPLPVRMPSAVPSRAVIASVALVAAVAVASPLAHAAGNTLGTQMQTASQDLTTGGGYVLELVGYIVGIAAMLAGGFTIWQHTKNPNGQHRMSYGIISVLAGGFFLALSTMAQFSSNTVSGGNATNTGTSQQLTIQ